MVSGNQQLQKQYDYVVTGAGLFGMSAAYHLQKEGHSVLVVDAAPDPSETDITLLNGQMQTRSAGTTRAFSSCGQTHPQGTEICRASLKTIKEELEENPGDIFTPRPYLRTAHMKSTILQALEEEAKQKKIPYKRLKNNNHQLKKDYGIEIPQNHHGFLEEAEGDNPSSGVMRPDVTLKKMREKIEAKKEDPEKNCHVVYDFKMDKNSLEKKLLGEYPVKIKIGGQAISAKHHLDARGIATIVDNLGSDDPVLSSQIYQSKSPVLEYEARAMVQSPPPMLTRYDDKDEPISHDIYDVGKQTLKVCGFAHAENRKNVESSDPFRDTPQESHDPAQSYITEGEYAVLKKASGSYRGTKELKKGYVCYYVMTPTGLPWIQNLGNTTVFVGDNGNSAKNALELGRIAAFTAMGREQELPYDTTPFSLGAMQKAAAKNPKFKEEMYAKRLLARLLEQEEPYKEFIRDFIFSGIPTFPEVIVDTYANAAHLPMRTYPLCKDMEELVEMILQKHKPKTSEKLVERMIDSIGSNPGHKIFESYISAMGRLFVEIPGAKSQKIQLTPPMANQVMLGCFTGIAVGLAHQRFQDEPSKAVEALKQIQLGG